MLEECWGIFHNWYFEKLNAKYVLSKLLIITRYCNTSKCHGYSKSSNSISKDLFHLISFQFQRTTEKKSYKSLIKFHFLQIEIRLVRFTSFNVKFLWIIEFDNFFCCFIPAEEIKQVMIKWKKVRKIIIDVKVGSFMNS